MNWWVLRRRLHISWIISIYSSGIFIGIFLAKFIVYQSILIFILSILIITTSFARRYIYMIPLVLIGGILLGLWRGSAMQSELESYKQYLGSLNSIKGSVKDDVDIDASGQIKIRLGDVSINNVKLPGMLLVTSKNSNIKRGDLIILSGVISPGFGSFSGVIYRASINLIIHPKPGDVARVARDWFSNIISKYIPSPASSLGIGFLLGQRRSLPSNLAESLQLAGLTHIVVASGYNLTILVRLARRLFSRVSKYLSALMSSLLIVSFIAVTGLSPSMVRAGLVSFLSLAAWYYGRKFHPITLLSIAVAITVFINPNYAWGDLGWQLSFLAFAGVMILAPLIQAYLFGEKKPLFIHQILIETVSAQIATFPILIMAFGQISNVAIISNLLVLPLIPLAMLLTFATGALGFILPVFINLIAWPTTMLLNYMVVVAEFMAELPWAIGEMELRWWGLLIYYVLIMFVCFYIQRITSYSLREVNLVE